MACCTGYSGLIICGERLGGLQLKNIGPIHVQTLLSELEREGAGARTRQAVFTLLNQSFKQAIRWDLIRRNACDGVDRPRVPRSKIRVLDPEESRQLLAAAHGDRLEALYVLALTTGLRQGELLGLRWSDIDLPGATLGVQRGLTELNGKLEFSEPKTARSRRRVDLPALAVSALESHRQRQTALPHPTALVFTDTIGGPIRKQNLVRRSFKPLLKRAGLPPIRFHDLRHTTASYLAMNGASLHEIAAILGHKTLAMVQRYAHLSEQHTASVVERMNKAVFGD